MFCSACGGSSSWPSSSAANQLGGLAGFAKERAALRRLERARQKAERALTKECQLPKKKTKPGSAGRGMEFRTCLKVADRTCGQTAFCRVSRSRASGLAASGVPHDGGISDGTSCARSRVPRCRPSFTSQLTAREFFRLLATSFPACHRYARWVRTLSVLRRSCIRFDCRPRFTAGRLLGPGYTAILVR
jgi:hypothetical protein